MEEAKTRHLGGSLPVENVQQLAAKILENDDDIPLLYIRPEIESDEISIDESLGIPVIDFTKLCSSNQLDCETELAELHLACKEWGFFQLINHGILDAIERMKTVAMEFFKLPIEDKMACAQLPTGIEGYGQAFVVSESQKLDWGDMLFILAQPVPPRNMRFWPLSPPAFRSTLDEYSSELHRVARTLLGSMEKNLGVEANALTSLFDEDSIQGIRMNYYPPCKHAAEKVMGLSPHSDATGLTLLIQVNQVPGLQIKKNVKWVPIEPLPDAIIINVGDIMEIYSNGEYSSIEHRAVVNPEMERVSVAGFHSPNVKAMVGPLPQLVKKKADGAKFKTVSHEEYGRLAVSSKLDGKSLLDHMRIKQQY